MFHPAGLRIVLRKLAVSRGFERALWAKGKHTVARGAHVKS
jgi:hypothetical protein